MSRELSEKRHEKKATEKKDHSCLWLDNSIARKRELISLCYGESIPLVILKSGINISKTTVFRHCIAGSCHSLVKLKKQNKHVS